MSTIFIRTNIINNNLFNLTLNKAQEILNSQNSDVNVYNDMYTVLNNAYTELELKENNFAEDGEK